MATSYYEQPAYLKELLEEPQVEAERSSTPPSNNDDGSRNLPIIPRSYIIIGIVVLVILILVVLLLSTRRSTDDTGTTTGDPNRQVILQWWGVFLPSEVVQPLIDEYESINNNVTIEYANMWGNGSYSDAVLNYRGELNRKVSSTDVVESPDIFMVHNSWVADYLDYAAPAPATVTDYSTFANTYYPAVSLDFGVSATQRVYGVPLWMDTFAILYNQDHLNSASVSTPPTDWTSFRNLSRSISQRTGNTLTRGGFAAGSGSNVSFAPELFNLLMAQNGVQIVNENGLPIFGSQTEAKSALDFYKDFTNSSEYTWRATEKNDSSAFLEGKVSMIFAPSYRYRDIQIANEDFNLGIDIGVSQVPQLSGQSQPIMNWADYWGNIVASRRPNSVYAWDFLNWMTQAEQLRKLNTNFKNVTGQVGLLSPRTDMANENLNDSFLKVFAESLQYAMSWQMVKGVEVEDLFIELLDMNSPSANSITTTQNNIVPLIGSAGQLQR